MLDFFFQRNKPFTRTYKKGDLETLPVAGFTVSQEWYDEKVAELGLIHNLLAPFADAGSNNEGPLAQTSSLQLAKNAKSLLTASTATIKRLSREAEQLTEQLDQARREYAELEASHAEIADDWDMARYDSYVLENENKLLHSQLDIALATQRALQTENATLREEMENIAAARKRSTKKKVSEGE